jgi:hypothetical protein
MVGEGVMLGVAVGVGVSVGVNVTVGVSVGADTPGKEVEHACNKTISNTMKSGLRIHNLMPL